MNWNKANASTKRAYARMWQIHLLGWFLLIPYGLSYVFGQLTDIGVTAYVLGAQAILILLIFMRPRYMTFIRTKFRNLSPYAIKLALLAYFLFSVAVIDAEIRGTPDALMSFGGLMALVGTLALFASFLGTCGQAFADLFDLH